MSCTSRELFRAPFYCHKMFRFHIVGEILSVKQNKFVCDVLEERGFNGNKVIIEAIGKAGDNYSANVKRIIVEREDGTAFKMVAKVAPTNEFLRKSLYIELSFANEVVMYNEVFPTLRQLEIDTGVPEADRFVFPICYGAYLEELHEIVLLEDLFESNFIMPDRHQTLKHDEVTLIVKKFAKLHSLSFLLRIKDSAKYKRFAEKLGDYYASDNIKDVVNYVTPAIQETMSSLLRNEGSKKLTNNMLSQYLDEFYKIKEFDKNSDHVVIVHGDAWINNILFKKKNNILQDCILIDYQLSYEKSPVADLHYLINSSTDHTTRSKHYHEWMDSYHDELSKRLAQFGLQVNYVYPKDKLKDDLKRYANCAFAWAIVQASIFSMNSNDAERLIDTMSTRQLKEISYLFKPEEMETSTLAAIKFVVEGLIESFHELGYFN